MKRKVIQMGGRTFLVSLPAPWIRRYGIRKGDELDMSSHDNNVFISTEQGKKLPSLKFNFMHADASTLVRTVATAYRLGYGELDLVFPKHVKNHRDQNTVKASNVVQDACEQLIGFEVIRQTDTSCYSKDVTGADSNEFENVLRRTFLMLDSFGRESLDAIREKDTKTLAELHRKYTAIRKYVGYCQRYLALKGVEGKTLLYHELVLGLMELNKTYRYLTKMQLEKKYSYTKRVLAVYADVVGLQEQFSVLFYTYAEEDVAALVASRVAILETINSLSKDVNGEDLILLHRLPALLNQLYSLLGVTMALHFEERV